MSLVALTAPGSARAFRAVQQLVLEDHHRVIVADGRLEDALGVVGVGDGDHFQARHADEIAFQALGVLTAAAGGANRRPHDQRHGDLSAGHVTELGDVVDDLVGGQQQEVAILDVGDGTHAHHRGAAGDAEEAEFGDGGVDHAVGKLFLQPEGHGKCAAPATRHGDIFAQAKNRGSRSISSAMASRNASAIPSRLVMAAHYGF